MTDFRRFVKIGSKKIEKKNGKAGSIWKKRRFAL